MMEFDGQLLFFFSALGAFNGLMMGLYFLLWARPRHASNYFLGALLLTLSIRIGKSVFFYFNPDLSLDYLQLGLTACFFIGPSLYFYLRTIIKPEQEVRREWRLHYGILAVVAVVAGLLWPFRTHIELWRAYIINSIYLQWMGYLVASAFLLQPIIKNFARSDNKLGSFEFWVLSVFAGNVVIWISYVSFHYTYYIVGALSFSFLFYLLVVLLVFNKNKNAILFKEQAKYRDKKIEPSDAQELIERLEHIMKSKHLYRDPNLKLPQVAKQLNILSHRLSQLLNDNMGKNFSLFINEYRVEEAKEMLLSDRPFTLEAIGYDCGFNSKSTFYSTFKRLTGTTPAKFKEVGSKRSH